MKVLVTGTAGFIGSHVAMRLLERGDEVVGIVNLSDYYDVELKKARLARFSEHPNYRHEPVDLADRDSVEAVFARHKPQGVINLAAQAGVPAANPEWNGMAPDPASSTALYRIFNIGNEPPVELMRYMAVLEECLGRKAQMELLPLQAGDVPDTEADMSSLAAAVGYHPRAEVEQGVANFVRGYREY